MPKSSSFNLALSPYHLATREPPAMAALLLGSHIVTLMPVPRAGTTRADIGTAVERSPRYLRLMEAWRWSAPLWKAGIVAAGIGDEHPGAQLATVREELLDHAALAALRPLLVRRGGTKTAATSRRTTGKSTILADKPTHPHTDQDDDEALDAIAGDLLRGGPDPAINVPITVTLDRFAARHALTAVRAAPAATAGPGTGLGDGSPGSLTQRTELRLGRRVFSFAMPILLRAGGRRLLELRSLLKPELQAIRVAMTAIAHATLANSDAAADPHILAALKLAVANYTRAFDQHHARGLGDDELGERVVTGMVSIVGLVMPADCAIRSAALAMRAMTTTNGKRYAATAARTAPPPTAPTEFFALAIREMSAHPIP